MSIINPPLIQKNTNNMLSEEFDTLVSSFSSSEEFGKQQLLLKFDEYEKSLFLTQAQEAVILGLYNGKILGDSFEKTEELRRYLEPYVVTEKLLRMLPDSSGIIHIEYPSLTDKSYWYALPENVWFIIYEQVTSNDEKLGCAKGSTLEVVPVTHDELHKIMQNPFRRANDRRVLRLDTQSGIELISEFEPFEYTIRYLMKPAPIILEALPEELSIRGEYRKTINNFNPTVRRMILETAVNLALKSRAAGVK